MPYYVSPPPMNPLSRLLAAILAVAALIGAVFFGVFVLAIVAGLGLLGWLYLSIRVWWIRRKGGLGGMGQAPADENLRATGSAGGPRNGDIIDAEYTVVKKQDEDS